MINLEKGKMVNISLDEAKELYRKGFQEIALQAYPTELLEGYGNITSFNDVVTELAKAVYSTPEEINEYGNSLFNTSNPLEVLMLVNKAMHLYFNKTNHYFYITKYGNIVKIKNPSTIENKTFCFATLEMARHVWKYFKDEVIEAANYVIEF